MLNQAHTHTHLRAKVAAGLVQALQRAVLLGLNLGDDVEGDGPRRQFCQGEVLFGDAVFAGAHVLAVHLQHSDNQVIPVMLLSLESCKSIAS